MLYPLGALATKIQSRLHDVIFFLSFESIVVLFGVQNPMWHFQELLHALGVMLCTRVLRIPLSTPMAQKSSLPVHNVYCVKMGERGVGAPLQAIVLAMVGTPCWGSSVSVWRSR